MEEPLEVPLDLLDAAFAALSKRLREASGPVISLDKDYYWSIPGEATYNPYEEPDELTIGELSECRAHLEGLVQEPSQAISYAFV